MVRKLIKFVIEKADGQALLRVCVEFPSNSQNPTYESAIRQGAVEDVKKNLESSV